MDFNECTLPHLERDHVSVPLEELIELREARVRVVAAERREAEAVADRRAAETKASQAEERAARAEQARAAALESMATSQTGKATDVAAAVAQEREAAQVYRTDSKTGLIEENRALGGTVSRLLVENEALAKRVMAALDALDAERKEHANLRASRPDVQIEADKSAADLEKARVEASVRAKEIESNHDLATMLLSGLGTALLPMSEKLLTKVLEEKFPRTLQAGTGAGAPPAMSDDANLPLQVWTDLLVECWKTLSPVSRMQAAVALARSRWLNCLLVPGTDPYLVRIRDEVGVGRLSALVQMTYALTGTSPAAPESMMTEQPADEKANGAPPHPAGDVIA